jgi:hypothetical protein
MIQNIFYTPINTAVQRKYFEHNNFFEKKNLSKDKFMKSNDNNPSFQGLSNKLKDGLFSQQEIKEFINKYSKSNGWIGSIPGEWEEKIRIKFNLPRKEHSEKVKGFYNELGKIISDLRESGQTDGSINNFSTQINQLMHKVGILSEKEKINIEKLGSGGFGTGYKLGVENDPNQYVIKVFHEISKNNDIHGNPVEANRGIFVRNYAHEPNESNGNEANNYQFTRFFFGDTKAGYILEQHIGVDKKPPKNILNPELFGVKLEDSSPTANGKNSINGYNIEYGGMKIKLPFLSTNSIARNIFEEIYKIPQEERANLWDDIYLHKHYGNKKHTFIGLAESLRLLNPVDRICKFEQLFNQNDNTVNEALAYSLYHFHPKEIFERVQKMVVIADNKVLEAFVNNLDQIHGKYRIDSFILIADIADNKIKKKLIDKLYSFPKNERTDCFKKLSENADNDIKKILADNLGGVQIEDRFECFKILSKSGNFNVNKSLAAYLDYLPKDNVFEGFKLLAYMADKNVKKVLQEKLRYLSENERVECIKILDSIP